MKRFTSLLLASILAILAIASLASCGGNKGIEIAVPNDSTNEARALLLLEANGLIKLKEGAGITATVRDIVENPYNIKFREIEAASLPNVLKDVDFAVINSNFAQSHQRFRGYRRLLLRLRQHSCREGRKRKHSRYQGS